jgi:hypothetical protein
MMDLRGDQTIINSLKICPLTSDPCNKNIKLDPKKIFLVEHYGDGKREQREKAINDVCDDLDLDLEIADIKIEERSFFCKICEQIQSSFICLVDLTNLRPNVLVELGMAYGFQKPVVIIFEEKDEAAVKKNLSDLVWADTIIYKNYDDLRDDLKHTIKSLFGRQEHNVLSFYNLKDMKKIKKQIELLLDLEKVKIPNIVSFKLVEGRKRVILDQGENSIKKGMFFSIHKVKDGIESEENFGTVEVVHTQKRLSQAKINYTHFEYNREVNDFFRMSIKPDKIPFVLKKYDLDLDETKLEQITKIVGCLSILM